MNAQTIAASIREDYMDHRLHGPTGERDHESSVFKAVEWTLRGIRSELRAHIYAVLLTAFPWDLPDATRIAEEIEDHV